MVEICCSSHRKVVEHRRIKFIYQFPSLGSWGMVVPSLEMAKPKESI